MSPISTQMKEPSFIERKLRNIRLKGRTQPGSTFTDELGLISISNPENPLIDIVFVHGLRGGSRKTWKSSSKPSFFWPAEWLARDSEFASVRIHSYGYDAGLDSHHESTFGLQRVGIALLESLSDCPSMKRSSHIPIIFIAYCTGGLVVKYASYFAAENSAFRKLAQRISSIYFLATPHRGEQLGRTLEKVIWASMDRGSPSQAKNLARDQEFVRRLHEQFQYYSYGIRLISCLETLKMNYGIGWGLVVDRDAGTTGYPGETLLELKLNHYDMSRFREAVDPNFTLLRNSLLSTIQELNEQVSVSQARTFEEQKGILKRFLNTSCLPSDVLCTLQNERLPETCSWLMERDSFQQWMSNAETPRYFWLVGAPGTGKTFAISRVIDQLAHENLAYHFFRHDDSINSTLTGLFKSLAFQMAMQNPDILRCLLDIRDTFSTLDKMNHRMIWQKLFMDTIFQQSLPKRIFWIIDALDECITLEDNYKSLVACFKQIPKTTPLKVFMTSRPSTSHHHTIKPCLPIHEELNMHESRNDIRNFVVKHAANLPGADEKSRQELMQRIVNKSGGNFLWTRLVMTQLEQVWTKEHVESVLDDVPQEMFPFYQRNLDRLSSSTSMRQLSKRVLVWTMCAMRPLSVEELKCAIELDLRSMLLRSIETSISSLCGELVIVDQNRKVTAVHSTAKAFLLNPNLDSEYRIDSKVAHLEMAIVCLKCLCSDHLRQSPLRGLSMTRATTNETDSGMMLYAYSYFLDHILGSESSSDELFQLLKTFLHSNVLFWIEIAARRMELGLVLKAGSDFKRYLSVRSEDVAPLHSDIIKSWAIDLPRIVAQFGRVLETFPAAIHSLIPPFCPRKSKIFQMTEKTSSGPTLKGLLEENWRERVSCIHHEDGSTKSITCNGRFIAVGLSNGRIFIYESTTLRHVRVIMHGESVRLLRFNHDAKALASAGLHAVKLWDISSGANLMSVNMDEVPLALEFSAVSQSLIAVTRSKQILEWHSLKAAQSHTRFWSDKPTATMMQPVALVPQTAVISVNHKRLCVTFRSQPVHIYDLETTDFLGLLQRPVEKRDGHLPAINATIFSPNPDEPLMAVAYWDEEIYLFDFNSKVVIASATIDVHSFTASQDGKTLATGDAFGRVTLLDFRTLKLLHRISLEEYGVTGLTFTSDSLRLLDIRGPQMNAWEPSALIRKDVPDEVSTISENSVGLDQASGRPFENFSVITSLKCCYDGLYALVGTSNGAVDLYELRIPEIPLQTLYRHGGMMTEVSGIEWNEEQNLLASVDIANELQVVRIRPATADPWTVEEQLLKQRIESDEPIQQHLISPDGKHLLVCTSQSSYLWELKARRLITMNKSNTAGHNFWRQHPQRSGWFCCFKNSTLTSYEWSDFRELPGPIQVDLSSYACQVPRASLVDFDSQFNLLGLVLQSQEPMRETRLFSIDISGLGSKSSIIAPMPCFSPARRRSGCPNVLAVLNCSGNKRANTLNFISKDGWVCTLDADEGLREESLKRHFVIPSAWLSGGDRILGLVTQHKDVVIAYGKELAVISNGLSGSGYVVADLHDAQL